MFAVAAMLWQIVLLRVQLLRDDDTKDRGASALEWAIIAGISVVAAAAIGAVVYKIVKDNSSALQTCANQAANGNACK